MLEHVGWWSRARPHGEHAIGVEMVVDDRGGVVLGGTDWRVIGGGLALDWA